MLKGECLPLINTEGNKGTIFIKPANGKSTVNILCNENERKM